MIEALKKEIEDLEKLLMEKRDQLSELLEDAKFANKNKLIVIVELHDQFYNISDIALIENTPEGIQLVKDAYTNTLYHYEFKLYKVKDLRKEYEFLQAMFSLDSLGTDAIQEWMNKHDDEVVNQ